MLAVHNLQTVPNGRLQTGGDCQRAPVELKSVYPGAAMQTPPMHLCVSFCVVFQKGKCALSVPGDRGRLKSGTSSFKPDSVQSS